MLIPLIAAVLTLVALDLGDAAARARRVRPGGRTDSPPRRHPWRGALS